MHWYTTFGKWQYLQSCIWSNEAESYYSAGMSHPHLQLTLVIYIQAALFKYHVIIPSMRHVSAYMGLVNYSYGQKCLQNVDGSDKLSLSTSDSKIIHLFFFFCKWNTLLDVLIYL